MIRPFLASLAPLTFATVMLAAPAAHATTYNAETTYFTRLRFDQPASGKPIAAVYAHVGVLTDALMPNAAPFWQGTQDVRLERIGDHFQGKATLTASQTNDKTYIRGEVVQYRIDFEDGSQLITATAPINATKQDSEYNRSKGDETRAQFAADLASESDIAATSATAFTLYTPLAP